ncbi:MAG: GAF domain-containing protein [Desulfocapsaceae bacterium]|nr:GAF domain-containing protein [Desulfocapsaceae bacterium]
MENPISSEVGFQELCRVGVALSVEKDIHKLLEMITSVARRYTNAEGCTLYLCNEERGCLDFSVVQNERLDIYHTGPEGGESDWPSVPLYLEDGSENHENVSAHCAITSQIINIADVYCEDGYDFRSTKEFDRAAGYRSRSMLLVPMQDMEGDVIGVLQLLNARSLKDGMIVDFPEEAVAMIKGLASQASVSVVNVQLINRLKKFTSLGVALSAEKNIYTLLDMIATMAREYTRAEGCTVYLRNEAKDALEFAVIQNDKLDITMNVAREKRDWPPIRLYLEDGSENHRNVSAHCALTREIVAIHDVYNEQGYDFSGTREFDIISGYRSKSMLLVPMTDHEDEVIGVLQLLNNRRGISPHISDFPDEDIQLVSGLASQAAVAVSNVRLVKGMETLLKSFVQCIATAIDEKSPYTAGHIQRVVKLTEMMVSGINETRTGPFADVAFSEEQMEEINLAAWMHDIGKITTPEQVVDKATKLEATVDRIELIRLRIELLRKEREIAHLRAGQGVVAAKVLEAEKMENDRDLDEIFQFIRRANIGGEFMRDEDLAEIRRFAFCSFELEGETAPLLNEEELECCSIRKGTLTEAERQIINHHVTVSIRMLESLPFLKKWARVPEYAGMHHEKLNGSGYPRGKRDEDIPLPARILAVADIFEALTAADRPYKIGKNLSEALRIMEFMVKDGHLDESLCDFLMESGIVHRYAEEYLADKQRDSCCWKGREYQALRS